jgi:ectoine hydroxylase-related dioxygenase (phytanoyl-CoA dioxygenase family)
MTVTCQPELSKQLQHFEKHGYAVIEDAISSAELEGLRNAYDDVMDREKSIGTTRGWQNNSYLATYNLAQKHAAFLPLLENPIVTAWMSKLLGKNFVVSNFNAHGMKAGGEAQGLHIDQDESTPGLTLLAQGLFTLDDFTVENGCTRVIPGSHRRTWDGAYYEQHHAEVEAATVRIEAPARSFVSWHGGLWHAGCANRTAHPRRCITLFCCRPWLRVHCDYLRSLSPEVISTLNETQQRRLGFFARPGWYDNATDELHLNRG